jgi:F-type H+-transporting ATPase subunit b
MKIGTLLFFFLFIPSILYAASGGDGVPMGTVVSQLANLSLLVLGLYFWQRKTIAAAFADKKSSFLKSVQAASQSKQEAEQKLEEIERRLQKMKSTYDQQIAEAKKNAEESYRVQVSDARNNAEGLKNMALNSIDYEVQRQIENLRIETFQRSAGMAEEKLGSNLTPEQLKAWNSQFFITQEAH